VPHKQRKLLGKTPFRHFAGFLPGLLPSEQKFEKNPGEKKKTFLA
jgi:hypothetical protein